MSNAGQPKRTLAQTRPDLAAQLADPSLATALSPGSRQKVDWVCPDDARHRWSASVANRVQGTGCPVHAGRLIIPGVNDLATTHPQVAALLADQGDAVRYTAGSNKAAGWRCQACGHGWTAVVASVVASVGAQMPSKGCPQCAKALKGNRAKPGVNDLATTHPELARQLVDPSQAVGVKAGSGQLLQWRCHAGHEWAASVNNRTHGTGCPTCAGMRVDVGVNDLATTHPALAREIIGDVDPASVGAGSDRVARWRCSRGHEWTRSVRARAQRGQGCPICAGTQVLAGFNDLATTHPDLARQLVDPDAATTASRGSTRPLRWRCDAVGEHEWVTPAYARVAGNGCPLCLDQRRSADEVLLRQVVEVLAGDLEVRRAVTGVLPDRLELDIVIPAARLAIEFNGLYWHSQEMGKSPTYHARKTAAARAAGLRLLHIWSDDWALHRAQVVRLVAYAMGANARLAAALEAAGCEPDPLAADRVGARSLRLVDALGGAAREFFLANHIQGPVTLTRAFGLADSAGNLRAVLGLRDWRAGSRVGRVEGAWEIQRYATRGVIPGGFTRLLAHATRTLRAEGQDLRQWVSFSANDIADGGMYAIAGFTEEGSIPPDYRYAGDRTGWRRVPKETYQRKRFASDPSLKWDESWTESVAAANNGLFKIWDAGKTRWVMQVP